MVRYPGSIKTFITVNFGYNYNLRNCTKLVVSGSNLKQTPPKAASPGPEIEVLL